MLSFTERMAAGRELAQLNRNRGRHVGASAKGWNAPRPIGCDANSWEWLCREARREWRSSCKEIRNDFAAACLSGPDNDLHNLGF
jgi:hypothetical protein